MQLATSFLRPNTPPFTPPSRPPNFVSRSRVIELDRYREIETCEFSSIDHVNARYDGDTETRTSHFYPTKDDGDFDSDVVCRVFDSVIEARF